VLPRDSGPLTDEDVAHSTVRGQYTKRLGVRGSRVPGLSRGKKNRRPRLSDRGPSTALRLFVDNWRVGRTLPF